MLELAGILKDFLVVLHLVGLAALLGGFLVQIKALKAKTAEIYMTNQVISPIEISSGLAQDDDYSDILDIENRSELSEVNENSLDVI